MTSSSTGRSRAATAALHCKGAKAKTSSNTFSLAEAVRGDRDTTIRKLAVRPVRSIADAPLIMAFVVSTWFCHPHCRAFRPLHRFA